MTPEMERVTIFLAKYKIRQDRFSYLVNSLEYVRDRNSVTCIGVDYEAMENGTYPHPSDMNFYGTFTVIELSKTRALTCKNE